jgi:hypothetical protein
MNKFRFTINALAVLVFTLAFASLAQAQASRTWVSGVGDDANPCSRTAPCKTFAGALSKTAANGEIDCLDPGGFGAVTINKSLTIDGTHGAGFGSVLVNGTPGIQITAGTGTVRLRNLAITGIGLGTIGIRVVSAAAVYIEGCLVQDFTSRGISDERAASGTLYITDTIVRNTSGNDIVVVPTAAATVNANLDDVHAEGSGTNSGIVLDGSAATIKATIKGSFGTGNAGVGLFTTGGVDVMVEGCVFSHNATGIQAIAPAVIKLSNSTITYNTANSIVGPAQVSSAQDNIIQANGGGNQQPTGPILAQS